MRRDAWAGVLSWWSCQSPVACSCGLLNHLNSFLRGMVKLNVKFDAYLLLYSVSYFECEDHIVHMLTQWHLCPYWLVQWSCHCSCMHIPVHCPWLSGHIDVVQTVLVILTMTGLLLDRPHTHIYVYIIFFAKKFISKIYYHSAISSYFLMLSLNSLPYVCVYVCGKLASRLKLRMWDSGLTYFFIKVNMYKQN